MTRTLFHFIDGFLQRAFAAKAGDQLLVAKPLHGLRVRWHAAVEQGAHLAKQPHGDHLIHPLFNPAVEKRAVHVQRSDPVAKRARALRRSLLGEGLAREAVYLQRADDAAHVVHMQPRRAHVIHRLQHGMQPFPAAGLVGHGLQLLANSFISRNLAQRHRMTKRAQIQSRTAHKQRAMPARLNRAHTFLRHLLIARHAERLARIGHIHHVVRRLCKLLRGGLGCADIHAAVDLHGIHADDLALMRSGKAQAQRGLSAGCRA